MGAPPDADAPPAGTQPNGGVPGDELAFLLDGGGARAAYQAGYLRGLGRLVPDLQVPVLVGVSAGAINATYLAAHPGNFQERTEGLAQVWRQLSCSDVFDVRPSRLAVRGLRWMTTLAGGGLAHDPRGLLDNAPLRDLLRRAYDTADGSLPGIARRIEDGSLRALAVTATAYATGQAVTFVQGRTLRNWERPSRRSRSCEVRLEHVMASAALPFLFPAEQLSDGWYGDGGIRLTTPLSPAIHLGADRILAVSTRYGRTDAEADEPAVSGYPPLAQVAGVLLNAVFLDALDGDALRLQRINTLLAGEVREPLKPVALRVTRPSCDLGRMATEHEHLTPGALRFFVRGTGSQDTSSNDLLSMILFEGDYLEALLAVGEQDAQDHADELVDFVDGGAGGANGLGGALSPV